MLCMMATVGVAAAGPAACALSGTLGITDTPAGGNLTGPTVTITVPGGNTGSLKFSGYIFNGTVGTQYSKNGGAFTAVSDPTDVVFANGDTLAMRITGAIATESWRFVLTDNTTGQILSPGGTFRLEAT